MSKYKVALKVVERDRHPAEDYAESMRVTVEAKDEADAKKKAAQQARSYGLRVMDTYEAQLLNAMRDPATEPRKNFTPEGELNAENVEERLLNGAPPTKRFDAPSSLKSHKMWSQTDYDYFRGKGYDDTKIKAFWDRDAGSKRIGGPVDWRKNPDFKPYGNSFRNGRQRAMNELAERHPTFFKNAADPLRCAECGAPLGKKPAISADGNKAYCSVHAPKRLKNSDLMDEDDAWEQGYAHAEKGKDSWPPPGASAEITKAYKEGYEEGRKFKRDKDRENARRAPQYRY